MALTKKDLLDLADLIALMARENAWETVRSDMHPRFHLIYVATAQATVDALSSDADYGEPRMVRSEYKLAKPLTAKQAATVRRFLKI